MTIYRRAFAACLALLLFPPKTAAAAEANFLLLRVVIGDYLLADAVEGEERGGMIYVNTAELAAALEEPPLGAQFAPVSELSNFFPAEFSADINLQELKVLGYGALGVEKRLLAEYESRIWRPLAKNLPEITPPRRMFAPPFAAFRHSLSRGADGAYYNSDSIHLYGDFAFGDGSLLLSESEGDFSGAHWLWRRDLWRFQGALGKKGGYQSAALAKRFNAASWFWNAELRHRKSEKLGASMNAAKQLFLGGNLLNIQGGGNIGETNSWRFGGGGKLRRANWRADYARYPGGAEGETSARAVFGFFLRSFAANHAVYQIRGGANRRETDLRHTFNIAGMGAEWRIRRAAESENTGAVALRKNWRGGAARYGARFSHERRFGRRAESRASVLSVQREKEKQTGFIELTHGHGKTASQILAEWRQPLFGDKVFSHTGVVFVRGEGMRRAFFNLSYAIARNPESGRWRMQNGFLGRGALSVCARGKNGEVFRDASLFLKKEGALDGCAFFPSAGGKVALDAEKLPPWMRAAESEFFAKTRPGVATKINFEIHMTGEVEGLIRRGGAPLPGVKVLLVKKENAANGAADSCIIKNYAEIESGAGGEVRETRTAFDGYYFFGEVSAGEYCLQTGGEFPARLIAVNESEMSSANIDLPPRTQPAQ